MFLHPIARNSIWIPPQKESDLNTIPDSHNRFCLGAHCSQWAMTTFTFSSVLGSSLDGLAFPRVRFSAGMTISSYSCCLVCMVGEQQQGFAAVFSAPCLLYSVQVYSRVEWFLREKNGHKNLFKHAPGGDVFFMFIRS